MYQIFTTIAGGLVGGILGGVTQYNAAKNKAKAYRKAADTLNEANEKYSGKAAYDYISQMGRNNRDEFLSMAGKVSDTSGASTGISGAVKAANEGIENIDSYADAGIEAGQQAAATRNQGQLDYASNKAQNMLKQADVDADVTNAKTQGLMNGLGGVADLVKNVQSDERTKNISDLPESSVEDSLRKIDNVNYKYKDETGLDKEDHTGVLAQSVENTDFKDMVGTGNNGYKMLDKQMMLEAVLAGCAALQKEIDELKKAQD